MPGRYIIESPGDPVNREQPHRKEMPLTRTGKPAAKCKYRGNPEAENRRRIIDPKTAQHHDTESNKVHPVCKTDDERMLIIPPTVHWFRSGVAELSFPGRQS